MTRCLIIKTGCRDILLDLMFCMCVQLWYSCGPDSFQRDNRSIVSSCMGMCNVQSNKIGIFWYHIVRQSYTTGHTTTYRWQVQRCQASIFVLLLARPNVHWVEYQFVLGFAFFCFSTIIIILVYIDIPGVIYYDLEIFKATYHIPFI